MQFIEDKDRRLKIILNIIVLLIAFVSVASRSPRLERASLVEKTMIDVIAPIQRGVTSLRMSVGNFFNYYVLNINASQENVNLRREILDQKGELFKFQEIIEENKRLKKLLEFGSEISYRKILAQVASWDASSDFKVIRINKGLAHGVKLQSPVVTSKGLVGYVYRLTENFSDVLTIIDSNNRVDALIKRVRSHGIIEGDNDNKMLIKYISRSEPIVLGDTAITSGLGNVYPKGIMVGKITRIEREIYGITQDIQITPAVDFDRLEEVIILILDDNNKRNIEWSALDNAESENQKGKR